jgi:hypothetical protein
MPRVAAMTIVKPCVAVCGGLKASLTWSVKVELPTAVGVPEMLQAVPSCVGVTFNPAGRLPEVTDQV